MRAPSILAAILFCCAGTTAAAGDRLLATGGVLSIDGTAGGGIVPWSVLAGYGTEDQSGCAAAASTLETDDYGLDVLSVACTFRNRLEISAGRQSLDLSGLRPLLVLPPGQMLRQRYAGVKLRLGGDLVYGRFGQFAAGAIYRDTEDAGLARAAGALDSSGTDLYLSAGKLFIDGLLGRYTLLNVGARWTSANQGGLLGYGGDRSASRSLNLEFAGAVFPRRDIAIGVEYRQKPDNLAFAREDAWRDVFVAWFPSKRLSLVAAWVDLGSIATLDEQQGIYLSAVGSF